MIYIADLGRWLKIRPDSNLCGLLWTVHDVRPFAVQRAYHALGNAVASRTSSPGDTSYTYYFISPRTAAGQFGEEIDLTRQNVVDFYDRRDAILVEHNIYNSSWWTDARFEVSDENEMIKLPTSNPLDRADYPILGYSYNHHTGRFYPGRRITQMLNDHKTQQQQQQQQQPDENVIAFVEVDA
jgi:hypothetical protein